MGGFLLFIEAVVEFIEMIVIALLDVVLLHHQKQTDMVLTDSNRHLAGTYQETTLDQAKKQTNRLIDICGSYVVDTIEGERLFMTKREFNKWAKSNEYLTDF